MRGTVRNISLPRRVVIDLMRASADVPFVAVRRTLNIERLAAARGGLEQRPAWATIFAKAFAILAQDRPVLRTSYLKWPWPRFYEIPQTVAMIVVAPDATPDGVLLFQVKAPDQISLAEADARVRRAKSEPLENTAFFRKTLLVTRLPAPLRRLAWTIGLNSGRQRANFFGTLLITSVAAFGGGEVEALAPCSFILSYDKVAPDGSIDVMVRWDHRVTDAAVIGVALSSLEQILNQEIAEELLSLRPPSQLLAPLPGQSATDPPPPGRIGTRLAGRPSR
jgi:hypothetical protein